MPDTPSASGEPQNDTSPPVAVQPGMPAPDVKPDETAPVELKKKIDAIGDPASDHPRFKEIYADKKRLERELEAVKATGVDRDGVIKSIQEHNKDLQTSIDEIADRYSDANRPDPVQEPEKYGLWVNAQIDKGIERAVRGIKKDTVTPSTTPLPVDNSRLAIQIEVQEGIHDDYGVVIREVQGDIDNDAVLRNKIASSGNPPKAAYEYGLEKRKSSADDRNNLLNRGYVEPGGGVPPPPANKDQATDSQVKMAAALGVDIDKYMAQNKQINEMKRRTV